MERELNSDKLKTLPTFGSLLDDKYGKKGTPSRDDFDAKAKSWYCCEVLKSARKAAGLTQRQLAAMVGRKREYIAQLEKGETDMQLSTFIRISEAVGLKMTLSL